MNRGGLSLTFAFSILVVLAVAGLGGLFVADSENTDWYKSIKPDIAPAGEVFGYVWLIIYFFIAISLFFSLVAKKKRKDVWIYYGINFFFNILWSFLFFRLHQPTLALFDILILIASTGQLIVFNWKRDKKASLLLIPYILWLLFALLLNWLIVFN